MFSPALADLVDVVKVRASRIIVKAPVLPSAVLRLAGSGEALTSGTDAARFQTLNGGVKPSDAPRSMRSKARAWGFFAAGVLSISLRPAAGLSRL
jgi:hypothetical protein